MSQHGRLRILETLLTPRLLNNVAVLFIQVLMLAKIQAVGRT